MSGRLVVAAVLPVLALAARPARAYVRAETASGLPFFWAQTCVPVTAYARDVGALTAAQALQAATAAADAWSTPQIAGTFLALHVGSRDGAAPRTAAYDGWSTIVFRADWPYDPAAAALTSVFVKTSTGQILEADIEVNAGSFTWADLDLPGASLDAQDLQNALTHEMGHLVGLDHPCFIPTPANPAPPPQTDNVGNPVPDCNDAPASVQEATMFPSTMPGDVSKRTLTPDEEQAVSDIYPLDKDPNFCPPPGPLPSGGCRLGAGGGDAGGSSAPLVVLCVAVAFFMRRRKIG